MAGPMKWLRAALLLAAGCAGPASGAEPGAAVVELLHGRPMKGVFIVRDPAAIAELRTWIETCYKEPPPFDEIGAVFPSGAVMFSRAGDREFTDPPTNTYVLYGPLEIHGPR